MPLLLAIDPDTHSFVDAVYCLKCKEFVVLKTIHRNLDIGTSVHYRCPKCNGDIWPMSEERYGC